MRERYKDTYWVYLAIMVVCIFIRWIPVSSGNPNIDDIINDIVIGGFSSTFVAFLIAWHDNKKDAYERQKISNRVTESFYSVLFQYLSNMEYEFFGYNLTDLNGCKVIKRDSFSGEDWAAGVNEWAYLSLVNLQNTIASESDRILDLGFDLITDKIISAEDIDSIQHLRSCIIRISDEMEKHVQKTLVWPKLVIRHNYLLDFFESDVRFTNKLKEMYPKYYQKYQYESNRQKFYDLDNSIHK